MASPILVARSKPKMWPLIVLLPATVICAWIVRESMQPDFEISGRGAGLVRALGPEFAQFLFAAAAIACLFATAVVLLRKINPKDELIVSKDEITSYLLWGRGTLAWPSVSQITAQKNFLFVHGIDSAGKPKKLVIDAGGLDKSGDEIIAALSNCRPDLVGG